MIANVDSSLNSTSVNPVQNKVLYDPVTFAESERQKSKNLFNKDAVLKNHEINGNNGTIAASTDYWVSDYIRVVGMSSVYISSTKTSGSSNVFYDNNYNILSISSKTNGVLSIPSNAVYMRCNGLMSELENNIQIEEGSVATEYQAYNGPIVHDKQLNEQLSNYLPLSGGAMTGQIKLHTNGFRTNSDDGYYTDAYGNFIYLGNSNTANFQIKDNTATAQIKAFYKSGRIETNGGIRINASGATTATSEYPVDIRRSSSGGDTAIKVTRTDTEKSMYFGIGSGGENRGIYDITKNGWQLHLDSSNTLHIAAFTADGAILLGQGDAKALFLGANGRINAGTSGSTTVFGLSGSTLIVGQNNYDLKLRGANTRPLYNDAELALKSDIISSDNFVTIDTAQTITGKKTFNNSISIGSCTQTYNASTKSLVYSFE